jgi:ribonucleoside-diphosphate reductase subunit M2
MYDSGASLEESFSATRIERDGRSDGLGRSSTDGSAAGKEKKAGLDKERKRFPEEEDEAILIETTERFVLFPIKYREVSEAHVTGKDRAQSCSDMASVQSVPSVVLDS